MGKLETVMKSEIVRLTKRELRSVCGPLRQDVHQLKRTVAQLRKAVPSLQKATAAYMEQVRAQQTNLSASEEEVKAARFSPGLIRALRKRLGLSQAQLAVLVGVSIASVGFWEQGRTRPSGDNRAAIVALRKLGKREVREILEQKAAAPKKTEMAKRRPARKAKRRTRRK